ncbi:hypothetical protein M4D52_05360 [Paenibacillus lactis]|uniref:hypothetical protein n=1 Tax=Paenibacillus lactis TaxID=228574 RepID=UPI00203DC4CE|nr:hypothetical protein [Paenibacillus lactis]MCM3492868.1 hypothetical protein [Paenibacillus lactis]
MNNQVKLIDADKILWELALQGFMTDDIKWKIDAGEFDPDTPPVPTIGCSECEYKGYFEYETGVVDEGAQIKEIAKEPCDCVIDRVPTIKPLDTRHLLFNTIGMSRDWQKDMALCKQIDGNSPWSRELLMAEQPDITIYWLQQYAAAQEEIARINCDYYADKQRFVVQRRDLEESKAREQKLKEAIERCIFTYDEEYPEDYLESVLASLYPKEGETQ